MLTVILTSYNRPLFVQRAVESVIAQTDDRWRLMIQDDGSDDETVNLLRHYAGHEQIEMTTRDVGKAERKHTTRYSLLINEILPDLHDGIVGYMCDNVEYAPGLVGAVLSHFEEHDHFAGYVLHERDIWTPDGELIGPARLRQHWNYTPSEPLRGKPIRRPMGQLDHSQVFHRLPTILRWPESRDVVKFGDGAFFSSLVDAYGPIHPIAPNAGALTKEHLFS